MITFNESSTGASHKSSGKPCQDYSRVYEGDGLYIVIVCDGHGADSYVRSDVGSRIATEIAEKKTLKFIENIDDNLFNNKAGAVTTVPTEDPTTKDGKKVNYDDLNETEQEKVQQNKDYERQSKEFSDIESHLRSLFKEILDSWREGIKADAEKNPFTVEEQEKQRGQRLEKAYGSTLIVAVCTQKYWFVYQIGDGKLLICDQLMRWTEPIPKDYHCFVNQTASLCDSTDPVTEFRYAFDGTGNFPIAFLLGSDGIDGTYSTPETLSAFYSRVLLTFHTNDRQCAEILLRGNLPEISEKGSRDDVSIAGIIDDERLKEPLEYYKMIIDRTKLKKEREAKEAEISALERKVEEDKKLIDEIISSATELMSKLKSLENKQNENYNDVKKMRTEFDNWCKANKEKYNELKRKTEEYENSIENKK